ncbi:hypothetical protein C0Q44_25100 [Paenibacillus sp. PCH8]|uniref:DUF4982 domain-containing protein n=1 Tax=Paenibacillus sp. PCH8 TaxID=2066524 RepID=UPI000CF8FEED|nr:DUF4982 domain-containing protein [Paenibacillus sp. PCH8]PQP81008.1 hypothetical protein C0Q44_25100 [Paenibacillus sp. PCH8]
MEELVLNGESISRVPVERLTARFSLPYRPGTLEAVTWKGNTVVTKDTLVTAGAPARIELTPDRDIVKADGMDLSFVTIRLVDENGATIPADDIELSAAVEGIGLGLSALTGTIRWSPCRIPRNRML